MLNRAMVALAVSTLIGLGLSPSLADPPGIPEPARKKVLVELYSSQGCDSCPPASDLMGKLARLGYGTDQVVAINFHVDYFNKPWIDPFSDPSYTRRQHSYGDVLKRNDLNFTPLMMVDGRSSLLGSDQPKALGALAKAKQEVPGVAIELGLKGTEHDQRDLSVKIASRSSRMDGRDLMVGVVVTQDRVATKVATGENRGRTLVEYHVARSFVHKVVQLNKKGEWAQVFPVTFPSGIGGESYQVAVFVQDRDNGTVYQAESIPWVHPKPIPTRTAKTKAARGRTSDPMMDGLMFSDWWQTGGSQDNGSSDQLLFCPDCGVTLNIKIYLQTGRRTSTVPTVPC